MATRHRAAGKRYVEQVYLDRGGAVRASGENATRGTFDLPLAPGERWDFSRLMQVSAPERALKDLAERTGIRVPNLYEGREVYGTEEYEDLRDELLDLFSDYIMHDLASKPDALFMPAAMDAGRPVAEALKEIAGSELDAFDQHSWQLVEQEVIAQIKNASHPQLAHYADHYANVLSEWQAAGGR